MIHILKVYAKAISFSVAQATIFRTAFFLFYLWLFVDTLIKVLFFSAIYTQVNSIGGWNFTDVFLLVVVNGILWDMVWCLFLSGFEKFIEDFSKGNFDFILLKPMNPLLYITITGFHARSFSGARLPLLLYAILFLPISWPFLNIIAAIIVFLAGIVVYHALFAIVASLAFWIIDSEPILDFSFSITEGSRFPVTIFPKALQIIFTFIIPIFLVANYPVMILQQMTSPSFALTAILIAIGSEVIAFLVWKFSIKHYSSASS